MKWGMRFSSRRLQMGVPGAPVRDRRHVRVYGLCRSTGSSTRPSPRSAADDRLAPGERGVLARRVRGRCTEAVGPKDSCASPQPRAATALRGKRRRAQPARVRRAGPPRWGRRSRDAASSRLLAAYTAAMRSPDAGPRRATAVEHRVLGGDEDQPLARAGDRGVEQLRVSSGEVRSGSTTAAVANCEPLALWTVNA